MKKRLFFLLLLVSPFAVAQHSVYQPFDVDSTAQPRGGIAYFNTFVQANIRKPILAQAKGLSGRVIVSGIVETDGRITDVKVTQSKFPELEREAARVFSLYNAWQPAQKEGKAVRQQVGLPIMFVPNTPFTYTDGAQINYFDTDKKAVAEGSDQVRYKQVCPLDTNGLPNGDIIVYKAKGTAWKEEYRLPLTQLDRSEPGALGKLLGYQNGDKQWQGVVYTLDQTGKRVSQTNYENGRTSGLKLTYHPNGLLAEQRTEADGKQVVTWWYANGQLKQTTLIDKSKFTPGKFPEQVTTLWDSLGHQLIRDGNGRATYTNVRRSYSDTTRRTLYVEQGQFVNGFKQGVWTGRYVDGSYFYEEQYDQGVCQTGKTRTSGGDTAQYTAVEVNPEFDGGMPGLGKFLAQNLRYPAEAQRARVQGQVLVSFVVCTDGTLCDYNIVKSVAPSVDQEAMRVVKATSGSWKPGSQRGQKVRVKFIMPINFTLQ